MRLSSCRDRRLKVTKFTTDVSVQGTRRGDMDMINLEQSHTTRLTGSDIGVAVVGVETTGFGRQDRIVEIAILCLDRTGTVIDEFSTLVNLFPCQNVASKATSAKVLVRETEKELAEPEVEGHAVRR